MRSKHSATAASSVVLRRLQAETAERLDASAVVAAHVRPARDRLTTRVMNVMWK
jgi:hypothetical protein